MNTTNKQPDLTRHEFNIGLASMAGSLAFGHAVSMFIGRGVGMGIGLVATIVGVLVYFHLVNHTQGLDRLTQIKMRILAGSLFMPAAGAIGTFSHSMIDWGLLLASLGMALFFYRLVKNGGAS